MATSSSLTLAPKNLKYSIHKWSSYSPNFHPSNILEDKANDQSSRWSSDNTNSPQFLIFKLAKPSIVMSISFGKFEKMHVCNLSEFKVYGGLNDTQMSEILQSGLRNDSMKETFSVRHELDGKVFPCNYIKIVPIKTFGPSCNFSVWFIELHGVDDPEFVNPALKWFSKYREREAIRLCLKHFRQHNYLEAFETLQKRTKISLEHPMLSELHQELVINCDYEASEKIIERAAADDLFSSYISLQDYKPVWTPIVPLSREGEETDHSRPGMRGGHQMSIDTQTQTVYLLGGWDGVNDLADFWSFSIETGQWTCLSHNTEEDGGPCARSCHKMCLDPQKKLIYTIGRYLDSELRNLTPLKSDFFVYDISANQWTKISDDTFAEGGPPLIFDHQMCMDVAKCTIYVFGGRVLTSPSSEERLHEQAFCGLFSYHCPTNTWKKLKDDCSELRSRIGHSMLFHKNSRVLYIFAGQRGREVLNDFITYNVDSGEISVVADGSQGDRGCTQRATIDPDLNEIHILSGLSKEKDKEDRVKNSFWVFDIRKNKWSCVYKNENVGQHYWSKMQHIEPCPRFAHQLVYDQEQKIHYLFGGNPGKSSVSKMRLDDFWSLKLTKPSVDQLLRRCKYLVRKHRFQELACKNPITALEYLQNELSQTVCHTDPQESREFQLLTSTLFQNQTQVNIDANEEMDSSSSEDLSPPDESFVSKSQLFDTLVEFFPQGMTHPTGNLVDLITF